METPHPSFTARRVGFGMIAFALALVAIDLGLGAIFDSLYPTVGRGQLAGVIHSAIAANADVLLLGASTVRHHYDDAALTESLGVRTFGTGLDGRGIVFSRGLYALVRERHVPKLVVLDVSYSDRDRTSARLLAPFYGRNRVVTELLGWSWRERVKLASHLYRYNGLVFAILANRGTPRLEASFEPLDGALPDTTAFGGQRRGAGGYGPWYGDALRRLVSDVRASGARIVFVESPTWGGLVAAEPLAEYDRVALEMSVPYYRLTPDREPLLNHAGLYYDHAHLNRGGAAIFTRLLTPLLRRELAR